MLTFQDQYQLAQGISGVADTTNTTNFKRDINQGGVMFLSKLGRTYNRKQVQTDIDPTKQYYQLPEDALRVIEVVASTGSWNIPLTQVPDEHQWLYLNQIVVPGVATHFFVRGFDEIGLYPKPSNSVVNGLTLIYEPKHILLTSDDFTTGTVGVTLNSQTLTHSAAGFTSNMVGWYFNNFDGSDGKWYKISGYVNSSTLTLENIYQGATNAAVANGSWRMGQVMDMPEEYLEAPIDYAMYRYYLKRGNDARGSDFKNNFQAAIDAARNSYGVATESSVVFANNAGMRPYNFIRDVPTTINH